MPSATSIVARSFPDNVIGVDNKLPWHLRTDLKHFKKRTAEHAVIMGRKTYESLGKPLPNRLNIVLSRQPLPDRPGVVWTPNPETALLIADIHTICSMKKEFFIIGGEVIFKEFDIYINRVWLTDVFTGPMNGDAVFDYEFSNTEWWVPHERDFPASEHDDFGFRISLYVRKKEFHRTRSREEFLGHESHVLTLIDQWEAEMEKEPVVPTKEEWQLSLFDS